MIFDWLFRKKEPWTGRLGPTPLEEAMFAKDPELYGRVSVIPITEFVDEWRKVYPEDFEGFQPTDTVAQTMYSPELIRPKPAPALS